MVIPEEINEIVECLQRASRRMPKHWDGRQSILEMKDADYPHWRQMEWMGFYFQFLCERTFGEVLEIPGKRYGKVEFDAFGEISWDFKAHADNTTNHRIITNDSESIENTMDDYGYYGLILTIGEVEYNDEERTFKRWHDDLKGGKSVYEINRIQRGAMSRRRKTEFVLSKIHFICLNDETLDECSGSFQKGFRNSDGNPRRSKVTIDVRKLPDEGLIASNIFE